MKLKIGVIFLSRKEILIDSEKSDRATMLITLMAFALLRIANLFF